MSDRYGIPDNMFGPVPEGFYALIGRVTMVATMLEDRLLTLLWAMDDGPQGKYAGQPFGQVIKRCRQLARELELPLAQATSRLLDDIDHVMQRRNEMVHSLWTRPELRTALGWRHVVPKHRVREGYPAVWVETDEDQIAEVIRTMVQLIGQCGATATKVQGSRSRGA